MLQFAVLLLWLARYSYRARELLVCWFFFCSFFVLLGLMFLGAVLAWHAGQYLAKWVRVARTVIPEMTVRLVELPQEAISSPRILITGTLALSAAPYTTVNALEAQSPLLIEVAPSAGDDVRK